jgi:chromosome segregation ATPase
MALLGVVCLGVWGYSKPEPVSAPSQARLRALELRCVQLEQDYRSVAKSRDQSRAELSDLQNQLAHHHELVRELNQLHLKLHDLAQSSDRLDQLLAERTQERDQAKQQRDLRTRERDEYRQLLLTRTRERDQAKELLVVRTRERDELQASLQTRIQEREELQNSLLACTRERDELRENLTLRMNERQLLLARCDKLRKGLQSLLNEADIKAERPAQASE